MRHIYLQIQFLKQKASDYLYNIIKYLSLTFPSYKFMKLLAATIQIFLLYRFKYYLYNNIPFMFICFRKFIIISLVHFPFYKFYCRELWNCKLQILKVFVCIVIIQWILSFSSCLTDQWMSQYNLTYSIFWNFVNKYIFKINLYSIVIIVVSLSKFWLFFVLN